MKSYKIILITVGLIFSFAFYLFAAAIDEVPDATSLLVEETIERIKSSFTNGLPLAGNWNRGTLRDRNTGEYYGFSAAWQKEQIENGHMLLPWFEPSTSEEYIGEAIRFARDHNLPISFRATQWENELRSNPDCLVIDPDTREPISGRNISPLLDIQEGEVYNQEDDPWYILGLNYSSNPNYAYLQAIYPNPPLVLIFSNNEPQTFRGSVSKDDNLRYSGNYRAYIMRYITEDFCIRHGIDVSGGIANIIEDIVDLDVIRQEVTVRAWNVRYSALLAGLTQALAKNAEANGMEDSDTWAQNVRFIGYNTFNNWFNVGYDVIEDNFYAVRAWDGISCRSYTSSWDWRDDYDISGPQGEAGNVRWSIDRVRETYPDFIKEVSIWYDEGFKTRIYERRGQIYSLGRYKGTVQFVLWAIQPQVIREFRSHTQRREHFGRSFQQVIDAVDAVHYNPILRDFWLNGQIVHNNDFRPLLHNATDRFGINRWLVLPTDIDRNVINWSDANANDELRVFSLAYVKGEFPNRQWLLYAHAPKEGPIDNVGITIPGYEVEVVDAEGNIEIIDKEVPVRVSVRGDFYLVDEATNTVNHVFGDPDIEPILDPAVNKGETVQVTINAYDPDGDTLTYSASNLPSGANFDPSTHVFTWTPDTQASGPYNVTFTVSDGELEDSEDITILVTPTPPTDLSYTKVSDNEIILSWSDNSDDETHFYIEKALSLEGPFETLNSVEANVLSSKDNCLVPNLTFYYRVCAHNNTHYGTPSPDNPHYVRGSSSYSNVLAVTIIPEIILDADEDGLPDEWEETYGLDPNNPADAAGDSDGDGLTNLEEYNYGTNPVVFTDHIPFQQEFTLEGLISIDASHYHNTIPSVPNDTGDVHNWVVTREITNRNGAEIGYSGDGAMTATPDTNEMGYDRTLDYVGNAPQLDYLVNFKKTGIHYIWIRGYGPLGSNDSVHAGLDGVGVSTAAIIEVGWYGASSWRWKNQRRGNFRVLVDVDTPGIHTFNIWMREDGFTFDRVVLTTDPNYTPSGEGPPESIHSIDEANNSPTANSQSVTTAGNTPVNITLTATDPDLDSLIYTIAQQPANGTLTGSAPNVTYTPNSGYSGADSFTFRVNDGQANSSTAMVTITVNPVVILSTYTITATAGTGGSIEPIGTVEVEEDDSVTFTITPANGYSINTVLVDGTSAELTGTTYTFTDISSDLTIEASFRADLPAKEHYVSPDGSPSGNGSIGNPWDLETALAHPDEVSAGDTIWLRGGIYGEGGSTLFTNRLAGEEDNHIILRQYPGERAIVDGGIMARGSWTAFWGFEITNSSPFRRVRTSERPCGLNFYGRGHKAINLTMHDVGHPGIGYWRMAGGGSGVYGVIMWGNGLYDMGDSRFPNGWTRGSGIYAQNQTGHAYIEEVISHKEFTTGFKMYTEGGWADNFHVFGNVVFNNNSYNMLVSARDNPVQYVEIANNFSYRDPGDGRANPRIGWSGRNMISAELKNNYFVGGTAYPLLMYRWWNTDIQNNTLICQNGYTLTRFDKPIPSQDVQGLVSVQNNGATLYMNGNRWKALSFPYTVTENTILEFDFLSNAEGEIHGIAFDTDLNLRESDEARRFVVYGTQDSSGVVDYEDYSSYAGTSRHYTLPVGQHYTGDVNYLVFLNDHDVDDPTGESYFSNVRVYESGAEGPAIVFAEENLISFGDGGITEGSYIWDNNTYYGGSRFYTETTRHTFDEWQASTGFDLNSTHVETMPTQNHIVVRPNRYEPGERGHIIVYNWEGLDFIDVDIAAIGLAQGDRFEIRDAENFIGEAVHRDTYGSSTVSLPMNLTKTKPLIGTISHFDSDSHTSKRFNAFVVTKGWRPSYVRFKRADYRTLESHTEVVLTVERIIDSGADVTVSYETSDDTAVAGGEYVRQAGTLSWAPGDPAEQTITIELLDDGTLEDNEMFWVSLRDPQGADLGTPGKAVVIIYDNEGTDLGSGLVGHWTFDDGDGQIASDSSGNGNDGSVMGNPVWTNGVVGGALELDGIDDYVDIVNSDAFHLTGDITVSLWINPNALGTRQVLVDKGYNKEFRLGYINRSEPYGLQWMQQQGDRYSSRSVVPAIRQGSWQHIVVMRDTSDPDNKLIISYKDGVKITQSSYTIDPEISSSQLNIGRRIERSEYFNGRIDDVRIYNRPLTPAEVVSLALVEDIPPDELIITTQSLPGVITGADYSQTLSASRGTTPYIWEIATGTLPNGLDLESSSGIISGTPAERGTFSFIIRVTDSSAPAEEAVRALSIVVSNLYTIEVQPSQNGSIIPGGNVSVLEGRNQTFSISPDPGYRVLDVLVDDISQGARTSYAFSTVWQDHEISASFAEVDLTPPVITLTTAPQDRSTIDVLSVRIEGTITDNDILSSVTLNGLTLDLNRDGTFGEDITLAPNSLNTITIRAEDISGNVTPLTLNIYQVRTFTISATPTSGPVPLDVDFSVILSDDSDITSYEWDFDGNGSVDERTYNDDSASFRYTGEGDYYVTTTIIDEKGIASSATVRISVSEDVGESPVLSPITASTTQGIAPLTVSLSADARDANADGAIMLYEWDFDGNGIYDTASEISASVVKTYTAAGAYTATLKVTDNDGLSAIESVIITVSSNDSSPSLTLSASHPSGNVPFTVAEFTTSVTGGGPIVRYEWDFDGDGVFEKISGATESYKFTQGGIFTVSCKVTDDNNLSAIDSVEITAISPVVPHSKILRADVRDVGEVVDFRPFIDSFISPDQPVDMYVFDFNGDRKIDFRTTSIDEATHIYRKPGSYLVKIVAIRNAETDDVWRKAIFVHVFIQNANTLQVNIRAPRHDKVIGGSHITLVSTLNHAAKNHMSSLEFRYSDDSGATWNVIGDEITSRPFVTQWDTTSLANGTYLLNCIVYDPRPLFPDIEDTITVHIDNRPDLAEDALDIEETINDNGEYLKKQKVNSSEASYLFFVDGTEVALPSSDDTSTVLSLADDVLTVKTVQLADVPKPLKDLVKNSIKMAGGYREISLSNSASTFTKDVTVVIPYNDEDLGDINEIDLKILYFDVTENIWKPIYDSVVFPDENKVEAKTHHFTLFGLGTFAASGGGGGITTLEGCFIATAAYGTPMAEEVKALSQFRDKYLLTNKLGKKIVKFYYHRSPALAAKIRTNNAQRKAIRYLLKPVVWLVKKME